MPIDRHKIGPYTASGLRRRRTCDVAECVGSVLSAEGTEDKLRALRPFTMVCLGDSLDCPPATAPEQRRLAGSADGLHEAGRYGHAPRRRRDVHPLFQLQWVQGAPCGADRHKIGPYDP
jgi:hypothetical protein